MNDEHRKWLRAVFTLVVTVCIAVLFLYWDDADKGLKAARTVGASCLFFAVDFTLQSKRKTWLVDWLASLSFGASGGGITYRLLAGSTLPHPYPQSQAIKTCLLLVPVYVYIWHVLVWALRGGDKHPSQYILEDVIPELATNSKRLGELIRFHALYTERGTLEKLLGTIGACNTQVKWAMARMVSVVLTKTFKNENEFQIAGQTYADFAQAFDACLPHTDKVQLTCIKSPFNWFTLLKQSPEWTSLKDLNLCNFCARINLDDMPQNDMAELQLPGSFGLLYPKHYVSFLKHPNGNRIFLLDEMEWGDLKKHRAAFEKFVRPCEKLNKLPLFVKLDTSTLKDELKHLQDEHPDLLTDPAKLDLNLFDSSACMIWEEVVERKGVIRFVLSGNKLPAYGALVAFFWKKHIDAPAAAKNVGIFTPDQVREEFNWRK